MVLEKACISKELYDGLISFENRIDSIDQYEDGYLAVFIHGSSDGKIQYGEDLITFDELAKVKRKELNYPDNKFLTIRVYCCYGFFQSEYEDEYTEVYSAYSNKGILECKLSYNEHLEKYYCTFYSN